MKAIYRGHRYVVMDIICMELVLQPILPWPEKGDEIRVGIMEAIVDPTDDDWSGAIGLRTRRSVRLDSPLE